MAIPDGLWGAVQTQESNNIPGVLGQPTRYGTPEGLGQLLPSTAQEMAGKLGLAWRPDLMTGTTPDAANYQRTLGQAYLQQGYDATGNPGDALRYYYGGPNRSMWGPKTNAYAAAVLGRWNQNGSPQLPTQSTGDQTVAQPLPSDPTSLPPRQPSLGSLANPMGINTGAMAPASVAAPASLGAMASALPGGNVKAPSKFNLGNILGVIGDGLMAYDHMQPQFGPFLRQEQILQQQQDFERQKFQQELNMRLFAMTHPQEMMNALAFNNAPQSTRQAMVDYQSAMHPTVVGVQQPNGSVVNQVVPHQLPYQVGDVHQGDDGNYMFMGGDPTNQANWRKVQ